MAFANPVSLPSGYRVSIVRNTNINQILHSASGQAGYIFRLSTRGSKLRMDLSLGRWIYVVLYRQHSRIDLCLLQHQSTSEEKHGRLLKRGQYFDLLDLEGGKEGG